MATDSGDTPFTEKPADGGIVVTTEFVRHRNALMARAHLTPLYLDYYLHLADQRLTVASEYDGIFKQALAAFILHAASRPRPEMVAWTISLQEPRLNIFATTDNETGDVIGRVFTENVKEAPRNLFYVETVRGRQPRRRSVIEFSGADVFAAASQFYENSEQRPGRFFDLGDENFVLLSAHPDCDLEWLRTVETAGVKHLAATETLVRMERRRYRWRCGCDEQRMFQVLAPAMKSDPDRLFDGDEVLRIECPRCAAPYIVSREALEAYIATHKE
jgi:molecular chaperone Hsp33